MPTPDLPTTLASELMLNSVERIATSPKAAFERASYVRAVTGDAPDRGR
jgi:hypothetical protein